MEDRRPRTRPVIAIDGPAGAGKSTLAAHLARRFDLLNLETGAMYRAFALRALESATDLDAEAALMRLAADTVITLVPQAAGNQVFLNGVEVTRRVREPEVTAAASRVSVHRRVRAWMVEQQRVLGAGGGVVMEGRDIGTVVFPDAEVKIFLDAAPEARGLRRLRQNGDNSVSGPDGAASEETLRELRERDARDRSRAESPLRPAEDAVVLDSTHMSLQDVTEVAEQLVLRYCGV